MAGLHYRMTFIDQLAESQVEVRSKSSPPVLKRRKQDENVLEILRDKKQLTLQVSKLEKRSQRLSSKSTSSNALISHRNHMFSAGSYGHPDICCRPCILFLHGHCKNAGHCGFCHVAHEEHMPTLDKHSREFLKDLPELSFMEMVLPYFRKRVENTEFPGAERILQLLESEMTIRDTTGIRVQRIPHKIRYVVERMSLGRLVSLVCSTLGRGKFPKLMSNELKALRQTAKTLT